VEEGFYVAPMGQSKVLTVSEDGGFALTMQDMEQYLFGVNGSLLSISDPNGVHTTLEYEGEGILLTKVSTPSGSLLFSYDDDGRLAEVADHTGCSVAFGYDEGRLTKVVQPHGAEFKYSYNAKGLMLGVTNPQGVESVRNKYDHKGRATVQHLADGGITYLRYDDDRLLTTITDQAGNTTNYHRDEKYRTIKIAYAVKGVMVI